jgi:tripartite-type tricarboxylate transporter receptor subunit TctC
MNKLLLGLIMLAASVAASAGEKVPGVWGFAVGSTQGTYFRAILEQANKEQDKYNFYFENKPGAGGSIASHHVFNHKGTAILAHSAAFFVRPNLYPETIYSFDQFKPLMIMGYAPATLVTKNKSLAQLVKQNRITIGTAGTGSSTHLMAETFAKGLKGKEVVMVHYKDTNLAFLAVMTGEIDATFEFLGDAKAKALPETTLIGLTGKNKVEDIEPLRNLGFKDMEGLSGIFAIYVPVNMSNDTVRELQTTLLRAEKHASVQTLYKKDYTSKDAYMQQPGDLTEWYNATIKQYKDLTKDIKVQ